MSDAITPALTPDEWARIRPAALAGVELSWLATGRIERVVGASAAMALANAALPDGDPRKLTRADVALIRGERFGGFKDDAPALWRAMDALAAKLDALLPPEPSHG